MNKIEEKFKIIRGFCEKNADPVIEKKYSRYFNEGYDAYGIGREKYELARNNWLQEWENEFLINDYILLGNKLISTGKYEEASFAIGFIKCQKEKLTSKHFIKIASWLENGIVNWAHTDVLCGEVLSYFIIKEIIAIDDLKQWINAQSKWKRRAIPVTLLDSIKTDVPLENILNIINPLMADKEEMVQKGLGWFLREAWKKYPTKTEDFILKWKDSCGRIIIQYATEKMSKQDKLKFKKSKSK